MLPAAFHAALLHRYSGAAAQQACAQGNDDNTKEGRQGALHRLGGDALHSGQVRRTLRPRRALPPHDPHLAPRPPCSTSFTSPPRSLQLFDPLITDKNDPVWVAWRKHVAYLGPLFADKFTPKDVIVLSAMIHDHQTAFDKVCAAISFAS